MDLRRASFLPAILCVLLLGGCSEEERRETRQHQERIAAEQARQQRLADQYRMELQAETNRRRNVLAAETQRQKNLHDAETEQAFNRQMTLLGRFAVILTVIGGLVAWVVHSLRRLGEKHTEERTKRHEQNLKAISGDANITPEQRNDLYARAIESANKSGMPLIGYSPNEGGAS